MAKLEISKEQASAVTDAAHIAFCLVAKLKGAGLLMQAGEQSEGLDGDQLCSVGHLIVGLSQDAEKIATLLETDNLAIKMALQAAEAT